MVDEKKLELLKKIQALAERGDRGEREAARKQLERLMEKYNVQEADLSNEIVSIHWFKFANEYERKLLHQVGYKIAPSREIYAHTEGKGKRTEHGIKCTKAEALQISIEFDFYKRLMKEEMDFFYRAFIQKHEIFSDAPPPDDRRSPKLTREELFRMSMMMDGMKDETLHQMIEEGGTP